MNENKQFPMDDESYVAVELTLDDGSTLECAVLTVYKADDKDYIALLPMAEAEGVEDDEVFLYRYSEAEDGAPVLDDIEDDAEYDAAADAFEAWLAEQDFED